MNIYYTMSFKKMMIDFLNYYDDNIYKSFMLLSQRGYKIELGVYGGTHTPPGLFCTYSETVNQKVYKFLLV